MLSNQSNKVQDLHEGQESLAPYACMPDSQADVSGVKPPPGEERGAHRANLCTVFSAGWVRAADRSDSTYTLGQPPSRSGGPGRAAPPLCTALCPSAVLPFPLPHASARPRATTRPRAAQAPMRLQRRNSDGGVQHPHGSALTSKASDGR